MKQQIQRFQSDEILKILGDPTRAEILRMLMAKPATISQIGEILKKHPAQIRHHIKQMEKIGVLELESIQNVKNYQEKYYQATANAFFINLSFFPIPPPEGQLVILGSNDPALNLLTQTINLSTDTPRLLTLPVGSLDGLIYLRENYCQISGCHLLDMQSGEYNISFVSNLFSDQPMCLITLCHREQGLLLQKGNPSNIESLKDLTRENVRFINRQRGAGTRIWLDQTLRQMGIDPQTIHSYQLESNTHFGIAQTILEDRADVGVGIFAAAKKFDLDFIPLYEERYDLVMKLETFESDAFQKILTVIRSESYLKQVNEFGGYKTTFSGKIIRI